jgi:alkylation response protein AidB-like acyl-CoA dehydrogenase
VGEEFEDDERFRAGARAFIAEHAPRMRVREGVRVPRDPAQEREIRRWIGALHEAGYLGAGWPVNRGGRPGHRPTRDLILMEELFRARAYRPLDQTMLASHAILAFGGDAQQDQYLPRIRSGEHVWCQLFSEPEAGSDLASLRTRATWDGTAYVASGQKIWCTDGQWADMGMLLARTDPAAGRHAGLTAFVVPMDTPGITVRPIREMTGEAEFCEVFLDDVRLPPELVLGKPGGGWTVISSGLASERAFVGANAVQLEMMHDDLVALARAARLPDGSRAIDHEDVQATLAATLAETEAAKLIVRDTVERIIRGEEHPSDGPVAKVVYTELNVELCERALELLTAADYVEDEAAEVVRRWQEAFLWSRALTISGGASEILRGLIGRQLLRLPRA